MDNLGHLPTILLAFQLPSCPIVERLITSVSLEMPHSTKETNDDTPFQIEEHWHSAPNDLRVICVGAGAAGLLMAYKMKKLFEKYELVVYEKNPSVAGTWYENRYPGCACDV